MSKKTKRHEKQSIRMSRREFVQAAAGVVGAAAIVPGSVLAGPGQIPPSERVNVAVIGTGGQGIVNIKALLGESEARIVALCDVNEESDYSRFYYRGTAGLQPALKVVNAGYAEQRKTGSYKGCAGHHDFVEMLDSQKNIDAVLIATPDHVHAIASLAAIQRGKHVYCEKPLTHSVYETRVVTEAVRVAGVATQMGNQGHSEEGIRLSFEWIRDGAIGEVREVHAWTGAGRFSWTNRDRRPEETVSVPATFDWNRWLGPVAQRPYHLDYAPYNWRGWWAFGTGAIGDMACHNMDPAFWALDLGHPSTVEASSAKLSDETVSIASIYHYEFPARNGRAPVTLRWYDGGLMPPRPKGLEKGRSMGRNGIYFVGDKGIILGGGWGSSPRIIPESKMKAYKRPPRTLARSKGHHRDWLIACKGGPAASSNFDVGGLLTEVVLLGNVALRTGKKLEWDGKAMKALNAPEADKFIRPTYHNGWTL